MIEEDVEAYLTERVAQAGGETRKVTWLGRRHAPDRYVILNGGHWVELKRPGEKPRPGQDREHRRMLKHGVKVHVIDTMEGVDSFVDWLIGM